MADSVWVLNLPLESAADSPILVHAVRRSPDALDLDLIATDGEDAWRYKCTCELASMTNLYIR